MKKIALTIIAILILIIIVVIFLYSEKLGFFTKSYTSKTSNQTSINTNINIQNFLKCDSNNDCTTTTYPLNGCCMECDTFPISKKELENQKDWRKNNCSQEKESNCKTFKCLWPDIKVKCINNKCAKE